MKIAIIGTGIAGMGCGYFLHSGHEVTLFDKNDYIGGHTNTVTVQEEERQLPVDTGFIVFNKVTYPLLVKLFDRLKVPYKPTFMSFSVQYLPDRLEYCGDGLSGLFAQRKNLFSIRHIRMLMDIDRFNKTCTKILDDPAYENTTLLEYVKQQKLGDDFLYKYLAPMSSAIWSTPTDVTLQFPARTLVRFFYNHGYLGLNTQHQWYTVDGGSHVYRDLLIAPFKDRFRLKSGVASVSRENGKAVVTLKNGEKEIFDRVIIAAHADDALAMLLSPTHTEQELLGAFSYQKNKATLHTDASTMPRNKKTWSAWNYRLEQINGKPVAHTIYHMNTLQGVSEKVQYFVSINDPGHLAKEKIIKTIEYHHPVFTVNAAKAQTRLKELNETGPVYFCGSYFRYGFHEDAFMSAVELCEKLENKSVWL